MEKKTIPMETLVPLLQLQMEQGGQASLTVTGSSMRPMLVSYRDSVLLTPVNGQLHLGDVILYRRASGQYVLHRIIKQTEPMICCGDNQWQQEEVFASQVIACVSAFCRNGRQYAVEDMAYRLYVWLMVRLFFLRRPYVVIRRALGNIRRAMKKSQNK